jgi:hypothetical protein
LPAKNFGEVPFREIGLEIEPIQRPGPSLNGATSRAKMTYATPRLRLPPVLLGKDWEKTARTTSIGKPGRLKTHRNVPFSLVPEGGLEPPRPCDHRILSPGIPALACKRVQRNARMARLFGARGLQTVAPYFTRNGQVMGQVLTSPRKVPPVRYSRRDQPEDASWSLTGPVAKTA